MKKTLERAAVVQENEIGNAKPVGQERREPRDGLRNTAFFAKRYGTDAATF